MNAIAIDSLKKQLQEALRDSQYYHEKWISCEEKIAAFKIAINHLEEKERE